MIDDLTDGELARLKAWPEKEDVPRLIAAVRASRQQLVVAIEERDNVIGTLASDLRASREEVKQLEQQIRHYQSIEHARSGDS